MDKTILDETTPGGKLVTKPVSPPPSGAGPMDSGGDHLLFGGGEKEEVEKIPEGFQRSKLVNRTPPKGQRSLSLDRTGSSGNTKKRKMERSPQSSDTRKERATLWLRLTAKIDELRMLVRSNPTTKMEIKKNTEDLQSLVTVLSHLQETSDNEYEEAQINQQRAAENRLTSSTVATQTEMARTDIHEEELQVQNIRSRIVNGMEAAQIKQLIEEDWPDSVFTATTICKGSIIGKEAGNTRLVMTNKETFSGSQLEKNLSSQVPGLKGRSASSNGLVIVRSTDSVQIEGEATTEEERLTIIAGLTARPEDKVYEENDMVSKLYKVRQIVEGKERSVLSTAMPEDADKSKVRKILECCFAGSQVKINLHFGRRSKVPSSKYPKRADKGDKQSTAEDPGPEEEPATDGESMDWKKVRKRREKKFPREQDRLVVVKQEGKSYSDILRAVKEGVSPTYIPAGAKVTSFQRSRNEDLLIRIKGSEKSAEMICKAVTDKVPGLKASVKNRKKVFFHVSDLDGETSEEDIIQGIKKELGDTFTNEQEIVVTSLRPAFAGTQKATVKVPHAAALRLTKKRRILIGWISCRLKIREEQQRCYRCWEMGHTASVCKGPDKSGACFKCGENGHQKASCTSESTHIKRQEDKEDENSTTKC